MLRRLFLVIALSTSCVMRGMDPEVAIITITPNDKLDISQEQDIQQQAVNYARDLVYSALDLYIGESDQYAGGMVHADKIRKKVTINSNKSVMIPRVFTRLSPSLVLTHDDRFNIMELWDLEKDVCSPETILRNVPTRPDEISCDVNAQKLAALFKTAGNVKVWDMCGSGQPHAEIQDAAEARSILCTKNYLVIGTGDGKVKFCDFNTQECVVRKEHASRIICMTSLGNGSIAVASWDGYASVYNLATCMCYLRLKPQEAITCIANIGTDGVITGYAKGFKVWDTQQKKCIGGYHSPFVREPVEALHEFQGMVALYRLAPHRMSNRLQLIDAKRSKCLFDIHIPYYDRTFVLDKQIRIYTNNDQIYDYDLQFACLSDQSLIKAAQLLKEKMMKHRIDRPLQCRSMNLFGDSRYITSNEIFDILKKATAQS